MAERLEDILAKFSTDEIELRSEEVQEILSRPPGVLVRWGITTFFVIIVLLFVGGSVFRYPDVVQGDIVITTEYPPVWMVSRTSGKLKEIFLPDRYQIKKGEVVAVMENPATTKDVLELKSILSSFSLTDSCICTFSFPQGLVLGEIQSGYNNFTRALVAYRDFLQYDLYKQKEQAAGKELKEYQVYIAHLYKQSSFSKEEMVIAETVYSREKKLHSQKVISDAALEEAQQVYLSRKHASEQLMTTLSSARIQEAKLAQSIIEIQMERSKEVNSLFTSLKSSFDELKVAITGWELAYLLASTADGKLSYQHVWQENQEIALGEKVFSVVSEQPGSIIGKISLPASGSGKVKTGQRVNIRITGYPHMEFGYLTGEIQTVSMLANEDMYTATVSLPQNLITSYKKDLTFSGELTGNAEIMTDERSLTARLFDPLRYLWEKHF